MKDTKQGLEISNESTHRDVESVALFFLVDPLIVMDDKRLLAPACDRVVWYAMPAN